MPPMNSPTQVPFSGTFLGYLFILSCAFVGLGYALSLVPFNLDALLFLNGWGRTSEALWSFLTQFGEGGVALLMLLVLTRWTPQGQSLALKTFLLGSLFSPLLKQLFVHPRPLSVLDPSLLNVIGQPISAANAMPSGHSLTVVACMTLLMLCLPKAHRLTPWGLIGLGLLALLSALSRVMVGAHWPSDVLAGAGFGGLVVWLAVQWEQRQTWQPQLQSQVGQVGLLLAELALVIYVLTASTHTPYEQWANDCVATLGIAGFLAHWRDHRRKILA